MHSPFLKNQLRTGALEKFEDGSHRCVCVPVYLCVCVCVYQDICDDYMMIISLLRRSDLLGCMSFGIHSLITAQKVSLWVCLACFANPVFMLMILLRIFLM